MSGHDAPVPRPGIQAYDDIRQAFQLNPPQTASDEDIWKRSLSEMDPVALSQAILTFSGRIAPARNEINSVILLAADLHKMDVRDGEADDLRPYIVHPLRNTLRLIRLGATDVPLLYASILHDTVEDHSFELARMAEIETENEAVARDAAFDYIAKRYGQETRAIVDGMSNPLSLSHAATAEEKRQLYAAHVRHAIEDPLVFACKVSDFIDNAVGLVYNAQRTGSQSRTRRGAKYLPVFDILEERLARGVAEGNLPLSTQGCEEIQNQLSFGRIGLERTLEAS